MNTVDQKPTGSPPPKVMAVASGGGHWVELRRLRPAWDGCKVSYVTTEPGYISDLTQDPMNPDGTKPGFFIVPDANQWSKLRILWQAALMAVVVLRIRPDIVISTGAAPGYFAIRFGRLLGARTVWLDSIANAEELSLAGSMSGKYCDLWLTQWEHLTTKDGPHYQGGVM